MDQEPRLKAKMGQHFVDLLVKTRKKEVEYELCRTLLHYFDEYPSFYSAAAVRIISYLESPDKNIIWLGYKLLEIHLSKDLSMFAESYPELQMIFPKRTLK
eukprot:TRINITY_DN4664_c0_g1_i11.p1 TRINITY_DN4664_c0_g1~~TRINITY_DN4664_c0_g1_i11.p1  ORF type:complete len:101 (+),score=9.05 TRINITY_DN4664_c0_g1_i11:85-387(+)